MRIVFVCTGNICRSPYAEYLARDLSGSGDFEFASAGTFARPGNAASPTGVAAAAELGLDLEPHGATLLTAEVVDGADVIYAMEDEHLSAVLQLNPHAHVELLRTDGEGVPDPYGDDHAAYLKIYRLIEQALRRRLDELKSERSPAAERP